MGWWPFANDSDWKALARESYNAKNYKKAEPYLNKMIKRNPNDKWALDVLSRLYINTSRHSSAIPLCITLIEKYSEKKHKRRLIDCCLADGIFAELWHYFPTIALEEEDEHRLERVINAYDVETWPTDFLETLIAKNPNIDRLRHIEIENLLKDGMINEAMKRIQKLNDPNDINIELQLLLSKAHMQSQNNEMANKVITKILEKIPKTQSQRRSLAKRFYYLGAYESSIQVANIVLSQDKNDKQMLDYCARIYAALGNHEQALKTLLVYSKHYELTSNFARRMLELSIKLNRPTEIVKAINIYKNFEINNWQLIERAASLLIKNREYKLLDEVLSIFDENSLSLVQFNASKMSGMGETVKAIDYLTNWLDNNAAQIPILMRLAFLNFNIGNIEKTIEICDSIISEIKTHGASHKLRIRAGAKIWEAEKLREEINLVRETLPNEIFFIMQAINLEMSEANDYKSALDLCEQGLEIMANDRKLLCIRAQCLSKLGNHKDAIQAIDTLFYHHPLDDESFLTRAQIMRASGDGKGQVDAINEMLKLHDFHPITSTGENNEITIEHLQCDAPDYEKDHGKVSIIMTGYKKDPLLTVAVNSILNQTYRDLELIIVDDNSPDDAFEFLQKLSEDDNRIKPFQMEENGGTYLAKNFGITQATGKYLAFMDSDDWTHPQRIERQVAKLVQNPNAQGVINDYFRIDENSSIPYRGNGSIRMACISLLLRKDAQGKIGFFDSLRVGADTEYIERLQAVYGESALIRDRIPNMFMTQHSSSLTGGGRFHISWRSIAGDRLQHHSAFREWHRKISCGNAEGRMERILRVRPFDGPPAMLSGSTQWREGSNLFGGKIQLRNQQWWAGKKKIEAKHLSAKMKGRLYVEKLGIKLPELYWSGTEISEIPELDDLPKKVVIKPDKGWSANNVWCLIDKVNILDGKEYSTDEIKNILLEDGFVQKQKIVFMAEEFLTPEKDVENPVPRDYKFYCFGSKIAMLHVVDRVSAEDTSLNTFHYFDENYKPIKRRVMKNKPPPTYELELPECFDEMVEAVKKIGSTLGIYMRIDMYATAKGAVFGEFTPTPHGGKGYSEWADKYLGSFWKGEEGCEDG